MMMKQKTKQKLKVKVTLVIDEFYFLCLHLHVIEFKQTNPLTTHNLKSLADPVLLCTTNLSFYSVHYP